MIVVVYVGQPICCSNKHLRCQLQVSNNKFNNSSYNKCTMEHIARYLTLSSDKFSKKQGNYAKLRIIMKIKCNHQGFIWNMEFPQKYTTIININHFNQYLLFFKMYLKLYQNEHSLLRFFNCNTHFFL